jgi:hypothetical protein
MTVYEDIYKGATYLLEPNYGFTGYRTSVRDLGGTTSIQTANQLKEVNNLLNQGMKTTELSVINPEVFEMIPDEQLKEINRLNKLTGAESTMHAPIIDPSGFTQQGWSEENREVAERQFIDVIIRSHQLSPNGKNMPVTIHASGIPGSEMMPEPKILAEGEKPGGPVLRRMIAVDQETGQFIPLEREEMYSQYEGLTPKIETPEERLKMANNSKWIQGITNLAYYKKNADELLTPAYIQLSPTFDGKTKKEDLTDEQNKAMNNLNRGKLFLDNVETSFRTNYEQAIKYGNLNDPNTKEVLNEVSKHWKNWQEKYDNIDKKGGDIQGKYRESILEKSKLLDESITALRSIAPPKLYAPVEEFAKKKASETLSNVAVQAYKKFGENAPTISIENPPYGSAISSGKDLKNLVEETRNKFVEQLVKQGKSESEAREASKRLIGVTWDTSHISMMRKQGFGGEQITKETKEIAPFVKHVHFNDNFGSTHTDLPPGKGNLPMKDIMNELDKANFKGKKIFEGGNWFQHFQTSPFPYQLEGVGAPLYTSGPYFNQLGGLGNYYGGYGPINPQMHHSLYGTSFTTLPLELGGEMPGSRDRFSGSPTV